MNADYGLILRTIPATIKANNSAVRVCRVVGCVPGRKPFVGAASAPLFVLSLPPLRFNFGFVSQSTVSGCFTGHLWVYFGTDFVIAVLKILREEP